MRFLLDNRLHVARWLFILTLLMLFIASCGTRKSATSSVVVPETESAEVKALREKFAPLLCVSADELKKDSRILEFVNEWYGVPYKYGGKDKNGIDCSAFSALMLKTVFNLTCGGSAQTIFEQCSAMSPGELQRGDLVFFKIESKKISHVGVYLLNNKFVHATTRKGVMINDLNDTYYKKYFFSAGRVKAGVENK